MSVGLAIIILLMVAFVVVAAIGHFYEPPKQTIEIHMNPIGDLTSDDIAEISDGGINVIMVNDSGEDVE